MDEKRDKRLVVLLTDQEMKAVQALADERGQSIATLVRRALVRSGVLR